MNDDFISYMPISGNVSIDVSGVCSQDWLPKIDKTGKRLCRDAFITRTRDLYRLCFVSGYQVRIKIAISALDAKAIIDRLGLSGRKVFGSSTTYRLTWHHVDLLSNPQGKE